MGDAILKIATDAAAGGHLNTLQWAMTNGCSWDESTCESAAKGGHVDVLEWCRVNGCPWDPNAYAKWAAEVAAERGVTGMQEWCTANGCPRYEGACFLAAEFGQLVVLKWARKKRSALGNEHLSRGCWEGRLDPPPMVQGTRLPVGPVDVFEGC